MSQVQPPNPDDMSWPRWQGEATRHMQETVRRFDGVHSRLDNLETKVTNLQVDLTILKTKVGIYSGLGACVGGGIVAVITQLIGGH